MTRSPRNLDVVLACLLPPLVASTVTARAASEPAVEPAAAAERPPFVERAAELGVDFVYFNGMSGEYYMPEINGAGCAVLDYDGDGDLDLFFVQGGMLGPGKTWDDALLDEHPPLPLRQRLYRNDLAVRPDGTRELRFTDVSEQAGLLVKGYGQGVATGDYDNDGDVDLYVTGHFHNQLFRNNGDGTFTDVTEQAGVDDHHWSVPATFVDYDRDGWLDLFVGNYVNFSYQNHKTCLRVTGAVDYCGPAAYDPEPDRLFRNRGDGTFADVTQQAGLLAAFGPALGVVAADFNDDGWPDLYVANDGKPNQAWMNRGDGTFEDEGLLMGTAVNSQGLAEAGMGVVAEDFDADLDADLFMTHLMGETNTFYRNDGNGLFADASITSRLGPPSRWATGFGVVPIDYDNDGWLDAMTVNGEVRVIEELAREGDAFPLHQPNQLFRNLGEGRFEEVTERAGPAFELSEVSRGLAMGDLDNDGDSDAVLLNNNGPARIFLNQVGQDAHWIGLRVVDASGRDALGAEVTVMRAGERDLRRRVHTDGSYASGNDPRVLVGLGADPALERIVVEWPDGTLEAWTGLAADRYHTLVRGGGEPWSSG